MATFFLPSQLSQHACTARGATCPLPPIALGWSRPLPLPRVQEQTTAMFRGLRRRRDQAAQFLALGPAELQRRHFWLCRSLGLEGGAAAGYLAAQPSLLLAEPAEAAAVVSSMPRCVPSLAGIAIIQAMLLLLLCQSSVGVAVLASVRAWHPIASRVPAGHAPQPPPALPQVHWLYSAAGWRRRALRRNLAAHPGILLSTAAQLEAAATLLQCRLDASLDELALLLQLAPRLLALPPPKLAAAVEEHSTAWRLAAAFADRPALMMREAAVRAAHGAHLGLQFCAAGHRERACLGPLSLGLCRPASLGSARVPPG